MARLHEHERPPDGQRVHRAPDEHAGERDQAELEALQHAVGNRGLSQLLDPAASRAIESRLGGGKPLSQAAPVPAEARGAAADARLHDDAAAAELSRTLGAVAFTFGKDIFLAEDAPALASAEGQRMLRHELTHVEQFDGADLGHPRAVSDPSSPAEQEAAHVADSAASARPTIAAPVAAHRQAMPEEEEPVQLMPAASVHRQEMPEEEELALMPAETVHRQEMPEEEEPVQLMPAATVHREEVPEEELALMPAETVHREDGQTEQASAPANPALSALFNTTVTEKMRLAQSSVTSDPPDLQTAAAALTDARAALRSVGETYADSDPGLYRDLVLVHNSTSYALARVQQVLGVAFEGSLDNVVGPLVNMAEHTGSMLH